MIIHEDGTGVPLANAYVLDVATAAARLSELGYPGGLSGFGALDTQGKKEAAIVRGAAELQGYLSGASALGPPRQEDQGLFFPRCHEIAGAWVPQVAIDASLLLAEAVGLELGASGDDQLVAELPPVVIGITLADGVEVRKAPGVARNPAADKLRSRALRMVDGLFGKAIP